MSRQSEHIKQTDIHPTMLKNILRTSKYANLTLLLILVDENKIININIWYMRYRKIHNM